VPASRNVNWLAWGGGACGCLIVVALAFVYLTALWTAKLAAKVEAKHLTHPTPAGPALEDDISVDSATGKALASPTATANYHFVVKLTSRAKSAILVQRVVVSFHDTSGHELASAVLKDIVIVPGPPQEFAGDTELKPDVLSKVVAVRARIVPTPLQ